MALKYPTDHYFFAPVLSRDSNCVIKDLDLRAYCQEKVSWFDWDKWGCRELDLTLSNLRELEQELGNEIEWVAAPFTYDELIQNSIGDLAIAYGQHSSKSPRLPSKATRTCTEALKVYPIAWHCYLNGNGLPWITHIGFRWDEPKRVHGWKCDQTKMPLYCDIEGAFKGKHRHQMVDYRLVRFPLFEDKITKDEIVDFWQAKGWKFPAVSNCDFCFFHRQAEHKHQYHHHSERMDWWMRQEDRVRATFGDRPLTEIVNNPQTDMFGADLEQFSCLCHD